MSNVRIAQAAPAAESYSVRPSYKDKFCPQRSRALIKEVVERTIGPLVPYEHEKVPQISRDIAENVRNTLRTAQNPRYKLMVQVLIGQRGGQGVRMGASCFWDSDTDNMATFNYINDALFCIVTVFACYLY
jgi:hypothetical protein